MLVPAENFQLTVGDIHTRSCPQERALGGLSSRQGWFGLQHTPSAVVERSLLSGRPVDWVFSTGCTKIKI